VENASAVHDKVVPLTAAESLLALFRNRDSLQNCYQCGKCTAGCPVAAHMDMAPNQVLRLLQLGYTAAALGSRAIWNCVSCQTCSSRCPKQVDCASIMDGLREAALLQDQVAPGARQVVAFQQAFLDDIRRNGRLYELELIARFKLGTMRQTGRLGILFKDARLAPQLQKRKKLHFAAERTSDGAVVERIFARCANRSES
jgi:heterodisulfide reductase subunit C2